MTFPRVPDWVAASKREEWERARFDAMLKRVETTQTAEQEIDAEFYKALFAVAQGSIARVRAGAEKVQTAATAIAGLYTPLLAVVFSITDNPLPSRGIIPLLFLGLAIAGSTAYLAYLTRARPVSILTPGGSPFQRNVERAQSLIKWTGAAASRRAYVLNLSVVALVVGLVFLPAPFVSFGCHDFLGCKESESTTSVSSAPTESAPTESTPSEPAPTEPGQAASPDVELPDWPAPSPQAGEKTALQTILYKAQVAEAVDERKEAAKPTPASTNTNEVWWALAVLGLAITLLAPLGIGWIFDSAEEGED